MQEIKKDKIKIQKLKEKLKRARQRNRYLVGRMRHLEVSRLSWKEKSKDRLLALRHSEKLLRMAQSGHRHHWDNKPKGYHYSSLVICLCLWFRTYCNGSLRGCVKMLEVLSRVLDVPLSKVPSHSSIYNWECKLGYYRIEKKAIEKGKWTLIIDESISIAQQRILLVLGCCMTSYKFEKPLDFKDIFVLSVGVDKSWTELCIGQQIVKLQARGYDFISSVSDGGKAIVKALKVHNLNRVADCTHAFGNLLERQYKKSADFQAFSKLCGQLKQQLMNGAYAYLIPPSQRIKGRFLNLFELSLWANAMIKTLETDLEQGIHQNIKTKLEQLLKYKTLILQIHEQCQTIKQLFKILKAKGLSRQTQQLCEQILLQSKANDTLKNGVKAYLSENVRSTQQLICCSDIIESVFGKFKNRLSKNKMNGFTLSCLTLANISQTFTLDETTIAMQQVRIQDLTSWSKQNLYPNPMAKRKAWLKSASRNFLTDPKY